jgi:hypothetical protein
MGKDTILKDGRLTHMYQFRGTANQALVIKLVGNSSGALQLYPSFVLQAPNQQVVAAEENTSRQRIVQLQVKLPATGLYTIFVSSVNAKKTGGYLLVVGKDSQR